MKQNTNKTVAAGSKLIPLLSALATVAMLLAGGNTGAAGNNNPASPAGPAPAVTASPVAAPAKPGAGGLVVAAAPGTAATAKKTVAIAVDSAADLPAQILQQITRGQDASGLIRQYRTAAGALVAGSLAVDRGSELRQFSQAEAALVASLRTLQATVAPDAAGLQQGSNSFAQWRAAQMVLEVRQQAILKKLQDSHAAATHLARHQEVVQRQQAQWAQVSQLLTPFFALDNAGAGNTGIAGKAGAVASAAAPGKNKLVTKPANTTSTITSTTKPASLQAATASALTLLSTQAPHLPPEPILHAVNLPVGSVKLAGRTARTTPQVLPSYANNAELDMAPEDVADSVAAPLSDEIVAQAKALGNDYLRIYEFVRNRHRSQWYAGSVKGAEGTLRSGGGNDVDQASLLLALLRASGVPGRYVHGVVELSLDQLANDLGLGDPAQVPQALGKAGIAYTPLVQGGRVVAVQVEHTWVSARVPYTNYRGAVVDASGKSWIPLDPSYKESGWTAAKLGLADLGSASALQNAYLAQPTNLSFAEFVAKRGQDFLQAREGTAVDYAAQLGQQQIKPLSLNVLPNTLPYTVLAVTSEGALLPDGELVQARMVVRNGSSVVLDASLPLHELNNQRLTLSYLPATLEDHRLSLAFGGLDSVPLYLIKLRPQLNLGGKVRAIGSAAIDPGANLTLEISLSGPFGSQRVTQQVVAGNYQVLGIAGSEATRAAQAQTGDSESRAAGLLDGVALAYQQGWNAGEAQLAALAGVQVLHPLPSILLVTNQMDVQFLGDTPYTLVWKGVTLDAISHPLEAVGNSNAQVADFMAMSGLHGSSLESLLFQRQFSVDAMSADKGLILAGTQNIPRLTLNAANIASLDASDHAAGVKDNIRNLVRLGYRVEVPASRLALQAWQGSVWRAQDEASGASGYFISGSLAGGSTATGPDAWTLGFLADALRSPNSDPFNNDTMAGVSLFKLGGGDGALETVGTTLSQPLAVVLLDKDGLPVKGAAIHFAVAAGGGKLAGADVFDTFTNELGIASAQFTLGTNTGSNPLYMNLNPGDKYAARVGWNVVDVTALTAAGNLHVDAPFSAMGKPDRVASLLRTSAEVSKATMATWADTISVQALDQYANPVPNSPISFSIQTQQICTGGVAGGSFKQGAVFDGRARKEGGTEGCPKIPPYLGDCGDTSLQIQSDSAGAAYGGVILGNDMMGRNRIEISGGGVTLTQTITADSYCSPEGYGRVAFEGRSGAFGIGVDITGLLLGPDGTPASGAKVSTEYKIPFAATVYYIDAPYELKSINGGTPGLVYSPFVSIKRSTAQSVDFQVSGGGFSGGTRSQGNGVYDAMITVGPMPGPNDVLVSVSGVEVRRPIRTTGGVEIITGPVGYREMLVKGLYAVQAKINQLVSADGDSKVLLDTGGNNASQLSLQYTIEPARYQALGVDLNLYENGAQKNVYAGSILKGNGAILIPRGTPFDRRKTYEAELVLNRGSKTEIKADKFPLELRQKLITSMSASKRASLEIDVVNKRTCERPGAIFFGFAQQAKARLSVVPVDANGEANGAERVLFQDKVYAAGNFSWPIDAQSLGSGDFAVTLSAVGIDDPTQAESASSFIPVVLQQTNSLPPGQVLVKGVKVKDGSLSAQSQGLSVAGRGPALHFQPTYSSAANGHIGAMGTNWSHNFESSLHINSCGEVIVSAGDGGSLRFFPTADGKLAPDLGYHGTLERNDADHSFDFFSKDGTRYHYKFINNQASWKVDLIEDTNGNTLTFNYDMDAVPEPRLVNVTAKDGRALNFKYAEQTVELPGVQGKEFFLAQVSGPGGLELNIAHDQFGNVSSVERNGRKETFRYNTTDKNYRARALMVGSTDPNGNATGYSYNQGDISFSNGTVKIVLPNSMVTRITTPTGSVGFEFDTNTFRKTTVTDENGNATQYELNEYGNPLTIKDPAVTTSMSWASDDVNMLSKTDARGVTTDFTWDKHGNLLSEAVAGTLISNTWRVQTVRPYSKNRLLTHKDRNGNLSSYQYDARGNRTDEDLPAGISLKHGYASNGDLLQTTDGNGGSSKFGYDEHGNLIQSTNPVGAVSSMQRDPRGRITASTDGNGNKTAFVYDAQDRMLERKDALSQTRSFTYDANGNKLSETDEAGHTSQWRYNKLNLPELIKQADGSEKSLSYDKVGNKLSETDFSGHATIYVYDASHRLVARTEPLSKKTTYTYDAVGNLLSETDGLGRTTSHQYDDLGHRTGSKDAAGGTWSMVYDGNGNKLASTDPLGRTTSYTWDGQNRLVRQKQPMNRTTSYGWDKNGNKLSEVDPNGSTAQYQYDAANRLVTQIDNNGKSSTHEYDKNNNLLKTVDRNRNTISYSWDALNRKRDVKDGAGYVTSYRYDQVGNLTEETLPNGNTVRRGYDNLKRLISSIDALGQLGAWRYDADGNKLSETDANGHSSDHSYNALHQLVRSTLPENRVLAYSYDVMGNRTSMTDAKGGTSTTIYDALNRQIEMIDAKGGSHRTTYDKVGNKLSEVDPNGNTTRYQHDDLNRVVKVTDALAKDSTMAYDAVGNKLSETNKRGVLSSFRYDKEHRLLSSSKDGLLISQNQYDDGGNLLTSTDANGNATSFEYDKRNLRIAENRLLAALTRFKLDAMGDVISITDPEGRVSQNSYDARRHLIASSNGADETTQYTVDGVGNRTSVKHPLGNITRMSYDDANRVVEIAEPAGTTRYAYDKNGNHVAVTDANGNTTGYTFDELNRRTGISYPGGAAERFAYDKNGNLLSHTDGNGMTVTHEYDALNRETGKNFSSSADGLSRITSSYDANNNVVAVGQTMAGATLGSSYSYDNFDRLQRHTDPFGASAITTYDANGNKTSLITQDGKVSRYSYDVLNRLTGIVGQSGTVGYSYDRSGQNTVISYSNGVASSMTYDAAKRVKLVLHGKGSNVLSRSEYEYDKNGNRSKEVINRLAGAQVTTYAYDTQDRMTQTSVLEAGKTVTTGYKFDAVGNRIEEVVETRPTGSSASSVSKTYEYDGRNQLKVITDSSAGNIALAYDNQGNLTQKTQGSDVTLYAYNANDNLISVSKNSTLLGRYSNDHLGLRIEKEAKDPLQPGAPPVIFRTLWDGRNAFQDREVGGDVTARYETDGHHPVAMWSKTDGSQALHHDALGSIVATTDASGGLKSETIYDAFGNIQEQTGQSANKFGYTGHQMDRETGLIYFQARYYDPQLGRFITQDPFEGDWMTPMSLHHYLYAYENPTTYVDLTGYYSVKEAWSDAKYYASAAVGGATGTVVGTYQVVVETVKFVGDAGKASFGDKEAKDRMTQRGRTVAELLLQPGNVKERIDNAIDKKAGMAQQLRDQGNDGEAGFELGHEGGKVFGPLFVARLRFGEKSPKSPASAPVNFRKAEPISAIEAPAPPPKSQIAAKAETTVEAHDALGSREAITSNQTAAPKQGSVESNIPYDSGVTVRSKIWNDPVEVSGRRVYPRDDLYDPNRVSSWKEGGRTITGTNIERMDTGRAPIGYDNKPVELHHLTQNEVNGMTGTRGALAEVGSAFHKKNTSVLHTPTGRNPNKPKDTLPKYPSFRKDNSGKLTTQAAEFEDFKEQYWKSRAEGQR